MDELQLEMLRNISDIEGVPQGAYNLRVNGKAVERKSSANVDIVPKTDKPGIDIIVKPNTKNERVDIPVLLMETGMKDLVYNDFYIGEGADVLIVAGCGIHNCGDSDSEHDGVHSFHVAKNAKVKYVEKHYGAGDGNGKRTLNPLTEVEIAEGGYMEMDTVQIKGVDSTVRKTRATLSDKATLVVHEKIMTHGYQTAVTDFDVALNGTDSGAHVVSRSVARDNSQQTFISCVNGNARCNGHTECDAIVMDNAKVGAIPKVNANHVDARLVHEAAIGKIAGEQLDKLMTLGLSEHEAEEKIINGFLR